MAATGRQGTEPAGCAGSTPGRNRKQEPVTTKLLGTKKMTLKKIVSRLAVTSAPKASPLPWLAKATAALKATGDFKLVKAYVETDEDDGAKTGYAVFLLTTGTVLLTVGGNLVVSSSNITLVQDVLKANRLTLEIGIYRGKIYVVVTDDCELFQVQELSELL